MILVYVLNLKILDNLFSPHLTHNFLIFLIFKMIYVKFQHLALSLLKLQSGESWIDPDNNWLKGIQTGLYKKSPK